MSLDPKHLAALAEILRLGSFEAAADSLGLTQSAVSQRLKALEDSFGSVLVERASPCRGTAAGLRLAAHADAVALMEANLARTLGLDDQTTESPRRIRLAVNADSLATWLPAALDSSAQYSFELLVDDESVSADRLRRGEVMAALTTQAKPVRGCDVVALGALRYVATASPGFLRRWLALGPTPEALAQAPMLQFSAHDDLQHNWLAQHVRPGLRPPVHLVPSTTGFLGATVAGLGWSLNPLGLAAPYLAEGKLVALLPNSHYDRPLYWQVSRIVSPALSQITTRLRRHAKKALEPLGGQRL